VNLREKENKMDPHENKNEAQPSNSGRATGPHTAEGKAKASQNALKHGLFSLKLSFDDAQEQTKFNDFVTELNVDLKAKGLMQEKVVEQIAQCWWQLEAIQALVREELTTPGNSTYAAAVSTCLRKLNLSSGILDGDGEGSEQHNTTAVGEQTGGDVASAQGSSEPTSEATSSESDQSIDSCPTVTHAGPRATDFGKLAVKPFGCEQAWVRMTSGDHSVDQNAKTAARRGTGTTSRELERKDHGARGQYELELRIVGPMQTLMRYQTTVSRQIARWLDLLRRLQGGIKPTLRK
jgi:hypothetical protein